MRGFGRNRLNPLLLDCDTGIDDALALAYLLGRPDIPLVGVSTVFGNTSATQAARNTLDLLALAGRHDVPVAVGAHRPMVGWFDGGAVPVHGANGFGDVPLPRAAADPVDLTGPELIVRLARQYPKRLSLLATGPLTNLALALDLDPTLPSRIARVIVSAGTTQQSDDLTSGTSTNFSRDPHAVTTALIRPTWPVVLVTMDDTLPVRLEEAHRQRLLTEGGPLSRTVGQALDHYFTAYESRLGRRCSPIHDPFAAAVCAMMMTASDPGVHRPLRFFQVDLREGPTRGRFRYDVGYLWQRVTGELVYGHLDVIEGAPPDLPDRVVSQAIKV